MIEYKGKEVIIMTCSDCNTQCEHCYISYKGNFDGDNLYNLCKILKEKYDVYLNGTEIIIHPEYFKTLKLLNQNFMMTNGLEIFYNPQIIPLLVKTGIKYIDMSYHMGIHNNISKVNTEILEKNIIKLLEHGIKTELRTTISKDNYMMIEEICKKAKELNACGIKFTNYMNIGKAKNLSENNILNKKEIEEFFTQLVKVREKYDKQDFLIRRCGTFEKDFNNPKDKFCCPAGKNSVAITPDLNVYPCLFMTQPSFEIGKVIDNKIMLFEQQENNGEKCLVKKIFNKKGC